jgi:hypothetical protein
MDNGMELEEAVYDAVDNALAEIQGLIKLSGNNSYLRGSDLEHMIQDIRGNLRSDPTLYRRLITKPLSLSRKEDSA